MAGGITAIGRNDSRNQKLRDYPFSCKHRAEGEPEAGDDMNTQEHLMTHLFQQVYSS